MARLHLDGQNQMGFGDLVDRDYPKEMHLDDRGYPKEMHLVVDRNLGLAQDSCDFVHSLPDRTD
jgi:hypothetical protein